MNYPAASGGVSLVIPGLTGIQHFVGFRFRGNDERGKPRG
jgi:hypothetical protein